MFQTEVVAWQSEALPELREGHSMAKKLPIKSEWVY